MHSRKYSYNAAVVRYDDNGNIFTNDNETSSRCKACGEVDTGLFKCKASSRCNAMYHHECLEKVKSGKGKCMACACLIPGAKPMWLKRLDS